MSQKYTFGVTSGTANGKVNPDILRQQILDAGLGASSNPIEDSGVSGDNTDLGRGLFSGGDVNVVFQSVLSAPDEAILNAAVAAHVGEKFAQPYARTSAIASQSNATTTLQSVFGGAFAVGPLEAGIWEISWYCEAKLQAPPSGLSDNVQVQVFDEVGSDVVNTRVSSDDWQSISGQRSFDYAAGKSLELDMQFRRAGAGMVADIRRCQVAVQLMKGK